jgi:phosphomevalonate kinase
VADGERKTGLGSSAALVSSLCAAVLSFFRAVDINPESSTIDKNLDIICIISQAAHAAAQGKVGSGFDISCALYGGQVKKE